MRTGALDCLHVRRQRLPDRRARGRRADPELYRACEIAYRLVGEGLGRRPRDRAAVCRTPGAFKRTANRHDYALPPAGETLLDRAEGRWRARGRHRQDRGSVRRARNQPRRSTPPATRGDGPCRARDGAPLERADLRESRRLRHPVRPSQRRRRATRANLERFDARLADLLPRLSPRRSADRHRRSRQRSDDPEHGPCARVRAAAGRPARACGRGVATRDAARRSPISGQTLAETFGVGALAHGTSFLA